MSKDKRFSQKIIVFHGRSAPETGNLVGYGAIIEALKLPVPIPRQLALISEKRRQYTQDGWLVFSPTYQPEEYLYAHLVFALKYEGINLLLFKKLFENITSMEVEEWVKKEPLGQYSRKIWFLYEWLMNKALNVPDLNEGNYVSLINEKLQYANPVYAKSKRHRINNNLPGTSDFCPLIFKTTKLENFISKQLNQEIQHRIENLHKDIVHRTSAFLLLKDSKASFTIEGEKPSQSRAVRWGRAIGEAGARPLSKEELLRLQQIIIENSRFVKMGYRTEGGFVGEHDRITGEPIPDHISAKPEDLEVLMNGLMAASVVMEKSDFHPILAAANIAFGFVFIHPFVDGNGRLHRYLIHHILSSRKFTPQGMIFPVSAAILEHIMDYRRVLEAYSHPLLDFIEWNKTSNNNIEVISDTIDYYRYFDATMQAEFLFECVEYTMDKIIPEEVNYLQKYDAFKAWLDDRFQMPDKTVALLVRFLDQNNGELSKRSREKEFAELTEADVKEIEESYTYYFKQI